MQPRKEHMLNIAFELFNEHGYHQTGIDTIMKASGVSKTTLYKYFKTKDELILEVLKRRSDALSNMLNEKINDSKLAHPEWASIRHIDAIFEATNQWINSQGFYGCNFIKAGAEYSAPEHPIHNFAAKHKAIIQNAIEGLLCDYPTARAHDFSRQCMLILDGGIVTAHIRDQKDAMAVARSIIKTLVCNLDITA
ncbi:MAG: AcrR family transcriptional regulator [Flavobacteriales bacterium]|jgi:AcrR family transcriptional regulator